MNQQHQQQPSLNTTYQSGLIGHQNLLENSPTFNLHDIYTNNRHTVYTYNYTQIDRETTVNTSSSEISSNNLNASKQGLLENSTDSLKPHNKHDTKVNLTSKRQKKMKFNNELMNYMYPTDTTTIPTTNYYHKQPLVGSSITSSSSSSTSSSPLLSSSPSHNTNQVHTNNTNNHHNMNQTMYPCGSQSKLVMSSLGNGNFAYSETSAYSYGAYPSVTTNSDTISSHSEGKDGTYATMNETVPSGLNGNFDLLDSSLEDMNHQRVKLKKSKRDPIIEYDSELAESIEFELGLRKQNGPRKNSWGNLSYAELITRAIESSAEQRLTLSQIYDWIVKYVPYFKEKFDRTSSAGWKNSIRHNLSLHNRFIRVQNESSGKSSWWMINPDMSKYCLNPQMNIVTGMIGNNNNIRAEGETDSEHQEAKFSALGSHESIDQEETLALGNIKTDTVLKSSVSRGSKHRSKLTISRQGKSSRSKQISKTSQESKSHSPQSPASTSSLKENDLLNKVSSLENNIGTDTGSKVTQNNINLAYFEINTNNNQQNSLMDSTGNIPYSVGIDSGNNTILRAALQKTNTNSADLVSSQGLLPGMVQQGSSYYNTGGYSTGNAAYVNQAFAYPNYSNYNDKQNFISNQNLFGVNQSTQCQSGYNNEGYFTFSNTCNKMPMTPSSTPSVSSPSSTTSSSNSTSSTSTPTNITANFTNPSHISAYPNYYGQHNHNQLESSQIYQNAIFKNQNHQYPSGYSSSNYYETASTSNRSIQSDDNNNSNKTNGSTSLEPSEVNSSSVSGMMALTSTPGNGYDELQGFQEIAMKPVGCYYS